MKFSRISTFLIFLISFSTFHANALTSAEQQTLDNILLKLERLNTDLNILQKQYYKNSGQGDRYISTKSDAPASPKSQAAVQDLEEKVRNLSGQVEQLQHALTKQQKYIEKMHMDIEERLVDRTEVSVIEDPASYDSVTPRPLAKLSDDELESPVEAKPAPAIKAVSKSPADLQATREMIESKQFDEATSILNKIVSDDKKDLNTKILAYQQLGTIYKEQEMHDKAAVNYLKAYKAAPNGEHAAISVLDLSKSLNKLGKLSESCNMLVKIKTDKVASSVELKKQANQTYDKFGCH